MSAELTKSAKKSLAVIYREYCKRLQDGESKSLACYFEDGALSTKKVMKEIREDVTELTKVGFLKMDITGGITITTKAIIFMENVSQDTIKEWLSFFTQFIP